MNRDTASIHPAIEQLRQKWDQLSDTARARALDETKRTSGVSNRKIAKALQCPESSIRRLLLLLHAPAADFAAARQGKISTNELLRRATNELQRRAQLQQKLVEQKRQATIAKASKQICNWLLETELHAPSCERIVNDARWEFHRRGVPNAATPQPIIKLPVREIIQRSKPPEDQNIHIVAWYAQWLIRWTFYAFPDTDIRDNALDLALKKVERW